MKLGMLLGAGVGYVLGTRDGRERYEQIQQQAQKLWKNPKVQEKKDQAAEATKQKSGELQDKASKKKNKNKGSDSSSDSSSGYDSSSASMTAATPGRSSTPPAPGTPATGTGTGTTGTSTTGTGTSGTGTTGTGGTQSGPTHA